MNLKNITKFLIKILPEKPKSAVILGSGLGNFVDFLEKTVFSSILIKSAGAGR